MKKFTLLLTLIFFTAQLSFGQSDRYKKEIFSDVTVTPTLYGTNATIAGLLFNPMVNEAVPRPLNAEVYQPVGDSESSRPAIILLHTGNFLPPQLNGGCGGSIGDADMINLATKLAKRGFVAVVADYRIGWNPTDPDQQQRTFFLINAAYRGVQDAFTCVRYLKKTVAEDNNPWGIDPEKIGMWGIGTGGYITYGAATLNDVMDTWIPKFTTPLGPMVHPVLNGDLFATTTGVIDSPAWPEPNDTLCYPNHVGYSSDFQLAVASGGALGDTSWIDGNDVPTLSFHVPTDPFAPCGTDVLIVPQVNFAVVEVMGPCTSQPIMNASGMNDVFTNATFGEDFTTPAAFASGGSDSFFPFLSEDPAESAPWNFAYTSEPLGVAGSDCDTDEATGQVYVDSMLNFFCPRACAALDLEECINATENLDAQEIGLTIQPNPAQDVVYFRTKELAIESLYMYNMSGQLVKAHTDINATNFEMRRYNLPPGIYAAQLRFADGIVTQRIVFK